MNEEIIIAKIAYLLGVPFKQVKWDMPLTEIIDLLIRRYELEVEEIPYKEVLKDAKCE